MAKFHYGRGVTKSHPVSEDQMPPCCLRSGRVQQPVGKHLSDSFVEARNGRQPSAVLQGDVTANDSLVQWILND